MSSTIQTNLAHSPRLTFGDHVPTLALLLLLGAAACESDGENALDASENSSEPTEAGADGGLDDAKADGVLDAEPDGDGDVEDTSTEGGAEPDDGTIGNPCETADDCDDGVFCNGEERCAEDPTNGEKTCRPALRPHCPPEHLPCDEQAHECNCLDDDKDNDGDPAKVCYGDDCDDSDPQCYRGAREICDDENRNEDCVATTVGERDSDYDGVVDHLCRNFDPDTGQWHKGKDCDDTRRETYPDAIEICDYVDNNCNGWVDEERLQDGTWEQKHGGQLNAFVPDWDGDGRGDAEVEAQRYCIYDAPRRSVLATDPRDCNDLDATVYQDAPELCDKFDNDCDGLIDADDTDLVKEYDFTGTTVRCVNGEWTIPPDGCPSRNTLWCPDRGDPISQGCRTDATRLSSCRACQSNCQFACGELGCETLTSLALGNSHTCGITNEGNVACWGRGASGQLGNDGSSPSPMPIGVIGIGRAAAIASGAGHTCAIVGDEKRLYCWGDNLRGQLGNPDAGAFASTPIPVRGVDTRYLDGVRQVAAGREHTCAVLDSGGLVCFGATDGGRLGDGVIATNESTAVEVQRLQPLPGTPILIGFAVNDVQAVAAGGRHTCMLTMGGSVECWGTNENGQLGADPSTISGSGYAIKVESLSSATQLVAGAGHSCALADGTVMCWGDNALNQLGRVNAQSNPNWSPAPAGSLSDVARVSSGESFSCATLSGGAAYCWGSNTSHQLGPGYTGASSASPILLPLANIEELRGGNDHACAIDRDHTASCWGSNFFGQRGDGSTSDDTPVLPTRVHTLKSSIP